MKVLIVEDEPKLVATLKKALEGEGYEVDTAYDGKEGYKKAVENDYCVILLDVMLPKMDGIEVCKRLRKKGIETPVVMVTAKYMVQDRLKGMACGANDYIVKPFSLDEFFVRIRAVL